MVSDTASLLQGLGLILTGCSISVAVASYFATVVREARQASKCVLFFADSGDLLIKNFGDAPITGLTLAIEGKAKKLEHTFVEPKTGVMRILLADSSGDCIITFQGPKGMRWECRKGMAPTLVDSSFIKPWKNVLKNFFGM
ncbi:hypothetical protein [Arthrobacter sp. S39]|uniref:hypothetical protein n=1 Tax=Arthrobacter sp. S39 TaxID=2509720 RepID=UPI001037E58B|nr:hypothetical protein [Arthrobacter sp. S39]TAP43174.1 hypothetical protein EYS21_13525 [Arthrobacter sp. S39]